MCHHRPPRCPVLISNAVVLRGVRCACCHITLRHILYKHMLCAVIARRVRHAMSGTDLGRVGP
eukprot:3808328-Rhodomonas_salina.1